MRIAERADARNAKDALLVRPFVLAANAEALDYAFVTRLIAAFDIVQKFPAQGHHFEQTTAGMIILFVGLKMLC